MLTSNTFSPKHVLLLLELAFLNGLHSARAHTHSERERKKDKQRKENDIMYVENMNDGNIATYKSKPKNVHFK